MGCEEAAEDPSRLFEQTMTKKEKVDSRTKFPKDQELEQKLALVIEKHNISPAEMLQCFPIFVRRNSLRRFLAHYDLFQRTINLPGDIVEIGVFRGLSLMSFANFLEIRCMGDRAKRVWGFDNFEGFTKLAAQDGPEYADRDKVVSGYNPNRYYQELVDAIDLFDSDRFVSWKERVHLVEGDATKTIPQFVTDHPGLRISLLHLDVDMYEPTKVALEHLYSRVVPGGVIVFDEYGILEWGGESTAAEEFLADKKEVLRKFEWVSQPGAYIIKGS